MEPNDRIDRMVGGYLKAQEAGVNAGEILARARRTGRRRRVARQAVLYALAAGLLAAVTAFVLSPVPHAPPAPVGKAVQTQEEQVVKGIHAAKGAEAPAPAPEIPLPALPNLAEVRSSLLADAHEIKGRIRAFMAGSMEKAGLVL